MRKVFLLALLRCCRRHPAALATAPPGWLGIIYLTPETGYGSYLLMQRAIPPNPIGGCYAG